MYYLLALAAILLIVFLGVRLTSTKDDPAVEEYIKLVSGYQSELEALRKQYISHSTFLHFQGKWQPAYTNPLCNNGRARKSATVIAFKESFSKLESQIDSWNEDFIRGEMMTRKSWFSSYDGRSLDEQQQRAVLTNEDNTLIVAGAGCGKTMTITAKIDYLTNVLGADPKEILILAFNRKAARELTERLKTKGIAVEAQTFHSLGLKIIIEAEKQKPKVDDQDILSKVIREYTIQNVSGDAKKCAELLSFFGLYSYILTDESNYRVIGEMYEHNRGFDFESMRFKYQRNTTSPESLKGERMRSIEETVIANFLFLHGVNYEYEKLYPHAGGDYRRNYTPDFYLPDYDIWLEHFGVNENNQVPWLSEFEGRKYVEEMKWKRETHRANNTRLIESYSYWKKNGRFIENLDKLLRENGVSYKKIDERKIYEVLYLNRETADRTLQEMQKLLHTFISLVKENSDLTYEKLIEKARGMTGDMKTRTAYFLEIAKSISQEYEKRLEKAQTIDFQDMISRATDSVIKGKYCPECKYIIIDEFQDISCGRYQLIKAIREKRLANLFCVGDDWQSIYRFTGCDVAYLSQFEKYFGYSKVLKIERTYRNSQELIDVVGPFIMANPNQIKKDMKSSKHESVPVRIWLHEYEQTEVALNKCIEEIARDYGENSSILLLARNNADLAFLDESKLWKKVDSTLVFQPHATLSISAATVHSSKGSEADNVIVVNASNRLIGFPNKMADDPIMSLVLAGNDGFAYAEERRLFYVALTRTRHRSYVLVPESEPSEFVRDIYRKNCPHIKAYSSHASNQRNPICPKCQRGVLVMRERESTGAKFVGCSLFPQCQNTYSDLSILKNAERCPKCGGMLVVRNGTYGEFYGCSNYRFGCTYSTNLPNTGSNSHTQRRVPGRSVRSQNWR